MWSDTNPLDKNLVQKLWQEFPDVEIEFDRNTGMNSWEYSINLGGYYYWIDTNGDKYKLTTGIVPSLHEDQYIWYSEPMNLDTLIKVIKETTSHVGTTYQYWLDTLGEHSELDKYKTDEWFKQYFQFNEHYSLEWEKEYFD